MARLTPITSEDQVPAKDHTILDSIVASRGAVQGPFKMFLHSPELAGRLAHLGAYVRFEGPLDMRVRVLAAMTVAREFEAVYVWGAQTGGARRLGVPEETNQDVGRRFDENSALTAGSSGTTRAALSALRAHRGTRILSPPAPLVVRQTADLVASREHGI